jgi:hypothetical protein
MFMLRLLAAVIGLSAGVASAQFGPPPPSAPRTDVVGGLELDPDRAAKVEAIMQAARARMDTARREIGLPSDDTTRATLHAAMEAIRSDMEEKLAAILSAEELARLRASLPLPRAKLEAMRFKKG